MSLGKCPLLAKLESNETCQSMPRSVPKKIEQQTVKLNYQGLVAIPSVKFPHFIRRLYLSHNKIVSLQGIEAFTFLQSVNISYNCLQRVQELRRIASPELLKHLKIRMNPLPYGYQDYAVAIFPQLRSFEDLKLSKETKQLHQVFRQFVSKNILKFMRTIELIIDIRQFFQQEKENSMKRLNLGAQGKAEADRKEAAFKLLTSKLHRLYVFPSHQTLANMSITSLLTLTAEIIKSTSQSSLCCIQPSEKYIESSQRLFRKFFESILIKMSSRFDKSLSDYLSHIQNSDPTLEKIQAFMNLGVFLQDEQPKIEARIAAGCVKSPSLTQYPAKYLKKISGTKLKQHPMNRLVNWIDPGRRSLLQSQETRWYGFYGQNNREEHEVVEEQVPLFVYCKQYLQVVSQIILDQVSFLLQLSHQKHSNNYKIYPMNRKVTFEQDLQEIEFDLSMSEAMSLGQVIENTKEHKISQKQALFFEGSRKVPEQTLSEIPQKVKDEYHISIQNYSLYQINLAFKVFRALKHKVKKKKQNH